MPKRKSKRANGQQENGVSSGSRDASVTPIDRPLSSTLADSQPESTLDPAGANPEPADEPEQTSETDQAVRITATQISDEPFPRAPRFDCEPQAFFDYWNSLNSGQLARCTVYAYRAWPVLDHTRGLTPEEVMAIRDRKRRLGTNIEKLVQPISPKYWYEEILQRWGSGDYHLKLNDAGVRNNAKIPPRQICQTNVRGLRDMEHHPPALDLNKLNLSDPLNRSYIEFLRVKGIPVPGLEGDERKDSDDMAAAERLAESVEKLAEKNSVLAATVAAQSAAAQAKEKDTKPVDVNSQASLAGMDIVKAAAQAALDFQAKATEASAKAQDPIVYHKNIMEAAERFKPTPEANGSANMMTMLMQFLGMMQESNKAVIQEIRVSAAAITEAQNARIRFTEEIAKDALARASNPQNAAPGTTPGAPPAAAAPPDPLAGTLKVLDVVDKIAERMGIGGRAQEGPWWARPAMTLAASIPTAISYAAYNAAVAKTGTGTPALPPQQPAEGEEAEEGTPVLTGPGPQQAQPMNPYIQFLQSIHKPLVNALDQNLPGFVFAGNLVVSNGWAIYDQLHAAGKDQVLTLLQSYPPVWQDVIKVSARFDQFLNEFLDRERVAQAAEEFRIAQQAATEGPPPAPQKVKITPKPKATGPLPQAVVDARTNETKIGG